MTTTVPPAAPRPTTTAFALAALAYALAGIAALPLAVPPGYATPLYPAAGIALAAVLMFGPRLLGAVALGALAVALWIGLQHRAEAAAPVLAGALALGATLQAFVGAALVRRQLPQPMALSEPRDIVRFLAAAVVSCAVSPMVTGVALLLAHAVPAGDLPFLLGTSYVGNLLGVLIATPVALSLCGEPREEWAPRRLSVGLTLGLALLLLALGTRQVVQWNRERVETAFNHDATGATQALVAQLREPLHALEALRGVFSASDDVSPEEMRIATRAWLQPGSAVQALGWSERIARRDVPAFEAAVRAEGDASFKVFDRSDGTLPAELADEVLAMHYIEPRAGNASAVGVNVWSIPASRTAVQLARRTGRPAATGPFRLTQQTTGPNEPGVVIYQALYARGAPDTAERSTAFTGVLFATLRMDAQLQALAAQLPRHLSLCLVDVTAGALLHLAGAPGCEARSADLQLERAFDYAGRRWEVRVGAAAADLPSAHSADVWLFALVGLLSTAMLGGFILIVTGRTRRIETAVRERTAALRAEVREREVAEGALRESEQRFRNILNNVPIGVIYTDLRGNVKQTNPRFCELTGYSDTELLRMSLADYTHPEDMVQDVDLMAQLVRGEIPMYRRHKRYIARNGATVWVQATVSLLRDANAKPRSIVGVVEDITEHLKLEEAERAREAAEASNRAKSEFLSRMSHELRTPLNAMLGFAQLLELDPRHPLSDAQRPWVGQIQQAGWHLLEMINDVLDLSRIESGNLRLQTETLDLVELLEATIAMVDGDAQQRSIVISQEFDPGTTTLLGDATRVKQILTNLLSNAVKYNSDAGRIHVSTRLAGTEAVEIVVTDTGLGMTAAQLAELFQPFNRLGRERSAQQGTGIGLVISQRLAELMGGSLRARSVAGQGSAFILTLPCALDPDTVRSDFDAHVNEPAEYHRRVVHYVEDNETNVEVMRGILAQRPQVEMQVSVTGLDGLAAIRAHRPDLILLDMHLPDISGMELLRHLKQDAYTVNVPIVVVSADALAQQIDAAFEAGCTHYLTKPVNVAELLGVLDDLLERMDTAFN